jgi:hypothetical protein
MLAECHLGQTALKPFLIKADATYTILRAQEDLEKAADELNYEKQEELLKSVIQMLNITRFKLREKYGQRKAGHNSGNDATQTSGNGSIRPGINNSGKDNNET